MPVPSQEKKVEGCGVGGWSRKLAILLKGVMFIMQLY